MDGIDYYQLGILDVLGDNDRGPRHTLSFVLMLAEEHELLSEYEHGRIMGEQLESGEGAIYDPTHFPA